MGRQIGTATQYAFLPGKTYTAINVYDAASNRTTLQAPDGSTNTCTYDTLNRLSNLSSLLTGAYGFGYDALGRRTSLTRPNGIITSYGYDDLSHLLSVLHKNSSNTTLDGATYTYDNAGNRLTKLNSLNSVTEGYTYDPLYQLTQVTQGASTTESYGYDAVGNRLSSLGVSPYNYNASNELTSTPSGSYTYDNNGNTLTDPSGKSYTWDFENRLTQVVVPGTGTVTFKYDTFGRRIQKSGPSGTTNHLYDGPNLLEEVDSSGNVLTRYSHDIGVDQPLAEIRSGMTSYYQADGLGSTTSLSSPAGTLASTYTYNAFGNLSASTGTTLNPFRYTGREVDQETGLYYYRARYLDSTANRFLSEDPLGFGGGTNFYSYVTNNPTDLTDPFGLCDPSEGIKKCLEKVFGKPIDKIAIEEKVKEPDYQWGATTRKDKIIIYIPCEAFFKDPDTFLEEYYHVLEQWNTGRLSKLKYGIEWAKHGYEKNKYEIEAKEWVKEHIKDFQDCMQCENSK